MVPLDGSCLDGSCLLSSRSVKRLVESMMPGTAFDADGIPASGWQLLSPASAVWYNPTPEQKLAHHTEDARHEDQLPSVRTRPEPFRADAGKLSGNGIPQARRPFEMDAFPNFTAWLTPWRIPLRRILYSPIRFGVPLGEPIFCFPLFVPVHPLFCCCCVVRES